MSNGTEDVSILDLNLDEVPDLNLAPEGQNQLMITGVPSIRSGEKDGRSWQNLTVVLAAVNSPNTYRIYHTLWLPQADDDEDRTNSSKRRIKAFMIAFGIPISGPLNLESWVGKQGFAILKSVPGREGREDKMEIAKVVVGS